MTAKLFSGLLAIIVVTLFTIVSVGAGNANPQAFDATKAYKKCAGCHGPKADKKFDPGKSDSEQVQAILKGKKAEKPPNMPAYESKGINAEQAKALVAYMKSLRS